MSPKAKDNTHACRQPDGGGSHGEREGKVEPTHLAPQEGRKQEQQQRRGRGAKAGQQGAH